MNLTEHELNKRNRIFKKSYSFLMLKNTISRFSSGLNIISILNETFQNMFWSTKLSSEFRHFTEYEKKYARWIRTFSTLLRSGRIDSEDLIRAGLTSELIDTIANGKYSKSRQCRSCKGTSIFQSKKTTFKYKCKNCKNGIYIP